AASVLLAAVELGFREALLLVRNPRTAEPTAAVVAAHPAAPRIRILSLDEDPGPAALAVSTVPTQAQTPELIERLVDAETVFDVVYDPWPTPLAEAAASAGRALVDG